MKMIRLERDIVEAWWCFFGRIRVAGTLIYYVVGIVSFMVSVGACVELGRVMQVFALVRYMLPIFTLIFFIVVVPILFYRYDIRRSSYILSALMRGVDVNKRVSPQIKKSDSG
jgi:hypothetical protein